MDYNEALEFLEGHYSLELNPATRQTAPDLTRMWDLVAGLGDVHEGIPTIHITGTNGKGSTSRLAIDLVAAHGLHVGGYSSPHLDRVNERITSNGEPISDEDFAQAVSEVAMIEPLFLDRWDRPATYFEAMAAAALSWMAGAAVDVRVVEVGMGGRWDATNVVDADVAVITNVGADHVQTLGPTLADIAREKSGIITPLSTAVLGEIDDELMPVIEEMPAGRVARLGHDIRLVSNELAIGGRLITVSTSRATYDDVFVSLHGAHQGVNAAVALAAVEEFFDRPIDDELVREVFGQASVPGRMEVVGRGPLTVVDGAHNVPAAEVAATTLAQDFDTDGGLVLVVGFNTPRDPVEMLRALGATRASAIVATQPDWARRLPADEVAAAATALGCDKVVWEPDVARAVDRGRALAGEDGVVLVSGSLYIVGPARAHLR